MSTLPVVPTQSHGRATLDIRIIAGIGSGPTPLAAFDDALVSAGVANFNLVRLSSVIPPGASVRQGATTRVDVDLTDSRPIDGGWGDRLYAVWAFESAERLGEEAWAGVAWVQDPEDGRGLFVEHEGRSEEMVRKELAASLSAIAVARSLDHLPQHSVVTGARCDGPPVGALVIAPYLSEPWSRQQGS